MMDRRRAIDGKALLRFCEQEHEWLTSLIGELASLESPTSDKRAVDRLAAWMCARLTALGWSAVRLPSTSTGDHVRAEIGDGPAPVLLLGHLDTVWPVGQLLQMPIRREDGQLYGPGVFDMKGGIAVGLLAVRALQETGGTGGHVVLLLTGDEEAGSHTSRPIVEREARNSRAVLVLEPCLPGGAVKTSRKGVGEFAIEVNGRAAHAGLEPERGVSAILELVEQIGELGRMHDPPRGVMLNVGRIEGGIRSNVVPDHARADLDVRISTVADGQRIVRALEGIRPKRVGASVRVTGGISRPPFERTPAVAALYEDARAVAQELGRDLSEGSTGGGSDGNFTGALGVPTLDGLGPEGGGAHARDEHVDLAPLPWRAAFIAALLQRVGSGGYGPAGRNAS
jgi:glutamate carboxypeptidase